MADIQGIFMSHWFCLCFESVVLQWDRAEHLNTHTKQADVQIHMSGSYAVPAMKETSLKEGDELQHTLSIPWHWVFGINDGKNPVIPEHSVSKDAALALRSTGLVLVNVPMLQLVTVRNECQRDRGAVPGFLIHLSVGVFPYLFSYAFYSAFSLSREEGSCKFLLKKLPEEKPGNPVQSRKAQKSWQKDLTSLQNT